MATSLVVGLFSNVEQAEKLMSRLQAIGMDASHYSFVTRDHQSTSELSDEVRDMLSRTGSGTGDGAVVGAGTGIVIGGLSGLFSSFLVPGIGAVLALGPLAGLLAGVGIGMSAGSLIGTLNSIGLSGDDADFYVNGVRRGATLVTVHTDRRRFSAVIEAMKKTSAFALRARDEHYYNTGLTAFDKGDEREISESTHRSR